GCGGHCGQATVAPARSGETARTAPQEQVTWIFDGGVLMVRGLSRAFGWTARVADHLPDFVRLNCRSSVRAPAPSRKLPCLLPDNAKSRTGLAHATWALSPLALQGGWSWGSWPSAPTRPCSRALRHRDVRSGCGKPPRRGSDGRRLAGERGRNRLTGASQAHHPEERTDGRATSHRGTTCACRSLRRAASRHRRD